MLSQQHNKRVLIVEDDIVVANLYKERLSLEGFNVAQAFNGDEGIKHIIADKPDLVLLDLMLPRKGGMHVLQIAKQHPSTKNIPVVVLTALLDEMYKQDALRNGATAFFAKAVSQPGEVVAKIKEILAA